MNKLAASVVFCLLAGGAWAQSLTIAALGDSLVHGYGLIPEQGFVPQMQDWLTDQGADVVLINAGASGDTTTGGAARIEWTLTPDVDALIVVLGGNDVLRGTDPALSRSNLDKVVSVATERGVDVLLVGMQAPGNYGPDYKAAFDAIYPDLAAEYGVLLYDSFFGALTGEAGATGDPAALAQFMQGDGIHPNAQGVARIVADMGPAVLRLIARAEAQ